MLDDVEELKVGQGDDHEGEEDDLDGLSRGEFSDPSKDAPSRTAAHSGWGRNRRREEEERGGGGRSNEFRFCES